MDDKTNNSFQGAGVHFYCDMKIKDKQIITANIISLVIKEWIFDLVPRIEILLNDDGMLTEVYPLQDGDAITVELKKPADNKSIKLTFSLLSYTAGVMNGNKCMQMFIVGMLKVKDFYSPVQYRSFRNQPSTAVLRQILTSEGRIELETKTQTNDTMTWLQTSSNMDFCKHVLKRSFIANDTMFLFSDTTGKFTYTSYKTESDKPEEGIARFDIDKYSADTFEDAADLKDYWYNTFKMCDVNPYVNATKTYGTAYNYYDTQTGKQLKTLTDNTPDITDLTAKDSNKINTISHRFNCGYLTNGNMHSRYYDALAQNDYYRYNFLSGLTLELNINALSKPRLLSKIKVILPSLLGMGDNEPLGGDYIVAGVMHTAVRGEMYKKQMVLVRNGFNTAKQITTETVATERTSTLVENY